MEFNQNIQIGEIGFHEGLQQELSTYPEKVVNQDGTVTVNQIKNAYFLLNDTWNIDFLGEIKQFEKVVENYKKNNKNIYFKFNNPTINLEVKYVYYHRMFNEYWSISGILHNQSYLKKVAEFLNEKYSKISSLSELDIDKAENEFKFWLNKNGYQTQKIMKKQFHKDFTT
ncbi:transposase [Metabacillus idriensis]|uniref:transposase n=1 Tax=Metabacillus idriensis TaxID=324768 RepID=UPI00203D875F|nr:transposase [Metabacillus idriensis]MCM3595618.1 transposase [Metabacillus idriensis]